MDGHAVVRFSGDVAHSIAFISGLRPGWKLYPAEKVMALDSALCLFILNTGSIGSK
jgi:hypothetical protein